MHEAQFAESLEHGIVQCRMCAHYCQLTPGQAGLCRVRYNRRGGLFTSAYGRPVAVVVEPIEKKRLFHVYPGSRTLSLGTAGCNMRCRYCINWEVSQRGTAGDDAPELSPAAVIDRAIAANAGGIAFTYNEPTIFYEYAADCAARGAASLFVVAKSNGYMAPGVLREMAGWLDAINVDLKGWNAKAHRRATGANLRQVLRNLRLAVRLGLWVEISTLLAPGVVDANRDLPEMARFIATELGPHVPWHLLRFYPSYQMAGQRVTSEDELRLASDIAHRVGLHYVYAQDMSPGGALETRCPGCRAVVLRRDACHLVSDRLSAGRCPDCGQTVPGVGIRGGMR